MDGLPQYTKQEAAQIVITLLTPGLIKYIREKRQPGVLTTLVNIFPGLSLGGGSDQFNSVLRLAIKYFNLPENKQKKAALDNSYYSGANIKLLVNKIIPYV